MRHPKLLEILEKLRRSLKQMYGDQLVRLILFGSQAREEAEQDSDIDVLVVLDGEFDSWTEIKRTGDRVADLCLEYGVVICNVFVSAQQFEEQRTVFLRNVQSEGVLV